MCRKVKLLPAGILAVALEFASPGVLHGRRREALYPTPEGTSNRVTDNSPRKKPIFLTLKPRGSLDLPEYWTSTSAFIFCNCKEFHTHIESSWEAGQLPPNEMTFACTEMLHSDHENRNKALVQVALQKSACPCANEWAPGLHACHPPRQARVRAELGPSSGRGLGSWTQSWVSTQRGADSSFCHLLAVGPP